MQTPMRDTKKKPYRTCSHCQGPTSYSSYYDRFGCPACLKWSEAACGCDGTCAFKERNVGKGDPTKEDLDYEP